MVTPAQFRSMALALTDASEAPHMERVAFRTTQRIFATMSASGVDANLKLSPELQELLTQARPKVFAPVPGGWGKQGWTRMDVAAASAADVTDALAGAHAIARVPNKPKKKR